MSAEKYRRARGAKPANKQTLGAYHQFPCGCAGVLPISRTANKFVFCSNDFSHRHHGSGFGCRVRQILYGSRRDALRGGYTPIAPNTPHEVIRRLMDKETCELCGEPLVWGFKRGQTPHLHHNHVTGEIHGFVHARCNIWAMEKEIRRLKKIIQVLLLSENHQP